MHSHFDDIDNYSTNELGNLYQEYKDGISNREKNTTEPKIDFSFLKSKEYQDKFKNIWNSLENIAFDSPLPKAQHPEGVDLLPWFDYDWKGHELTDIFKEQVWLVWYDKVRIIVIDESNLTRSWHKYFSNFDKEESVILLNYSKIRQNKEDLFWDTITDELFFTAIVASELVHTPEWWWASEAESEVATLQVLWTKWMEARFFDLISDDIRDRMNTPKNKTKAYLEMFALFRSVMPVEIDVQLFSIYFEFLQVHRKNNEYSSLPWLSQKQKITMIQEYIDQQWIQYLKFKRRNGGIFLTLQWDDLSKYMRKEIWESYDLLLQKYMDDYVDTVYPWYKIPSK